MAAARLEPPSPSSAAPEPRSPETPDLVRAGKGPRRGTRGGKRAQGRGRGRGGAYEGWAGDVFRAPGLGGGASRGGRGAWPNAEPMRMRGVACVGVA